MNFDMVVQGYRLILDGLELNWQDDTHLQNTPARAAKAMCNELCAGLRDEPPAITCFKSEVNEMVALQGIPVHSICAHHLLPFIGEAAIAYIPGTGKLLGLSKLARLVDYWSRRPQVQEELTDQIADTMAKLVMRDVPAITGPNPTIGGVGVFIRATHMCMLMRGVKHGGVMTTTALRGAILNEPSARDEFLRIIGKG